MRADFRLFAKDGEVAVADAPAARVDQRHAPVSYTQLRAHETVLDTVCRLLLDTTITHAAYSLRRTQF